MNQKKTLIGLIIFSIVILASCQHQNKERSVSKIVSELQESYKKNDYSRFCKAFPKSFNDLDSVYGYSYSDGPASLYSSYVEHMKFLFSQSQSWQKNYIEQMIHVAAQGRWDADGISAFQDGLITLIYHRTEEVIDILNASGNQTSKQFWIFILDGPHPDNSSNEKLINMMKEKYGNSAQYHLMNEAYQFVLKDNAH